MPLKVRTPTTNIGTGSIKTDFIKDGNVTLEKISTTGATDEYALTYDSGTDSVVWAQVTSSFDPLNMTNATPALDNTYDFGSPSKRWNDIYAETFQGTAVLADNLTGGTAGQLIQADAATDTWNRISELEMPGRIISNTNDLTDPGFAAFGGWSPHTGGGGFTGAAQVAVADNSIPFYGYRHATSGTAQYSQMLNVQFDYDISSAGTLNNMQLFAIGAETGGAQFVAANFAKANNITSAGSAGSTYMDEFDGEYTLTIYDKASGSNSASVNAITCRSDETTISGSLNVIEKPSGGDVDLSRIEIDYTGATTGDAKAEINLYNKDDNRTMQGVKLYDTGSGTEATVATGNMLVIGQDESTTNGNFAITNATIFGSEVAFLGNASLSSNGGVSQSVNMTLGDWNQMEKPVKWTTITSSSTTLYQQNGMVGMHPTSGVPIYYNGAWKYFSDNSTVPSF